MGLCLQLRRLMGEREYCALSGRVVGPELEMAMGAWAGVVRDSLLSPQSVHLRTVPMVAF